MPDDGYDALLNDADRLAGRLEAELDRTEEQIDRLRKNTR